MSGGARLARPARVSVFVDRQRRGLSGERVSFQVFAEANTGILTGQGRNQCPTSFARLCGGGVIADAWQ